MTTPPRALNLLGLTLLVPLVGCASGPNHFDAVTREGARGRQARYVLESEAGNEGSITIEADGEPEAEVDGRTTDTIRFLVTVDNASDDAVVIFPSEMQVKDDQNRELRPVTSFLPPGSPAGILRVDGRQRTSMEVVFDMGAPATLETTGSVSLTWGYEFRGLDRKHVTRFLPSRIRRTVREVHYFGVNYAHNPWWPHGYWGGGFYGHYW